MVYRNNTIIINKKNPKSTWKLINELNSRNSSSRRTISNIIKKDVDETFNSHFASVGEKLAFDIQPSAIKPEVYVVPAQTTFSMRSPLV